MTNDWPVHLVSFDNVYWNAVRWVKSGWSLGSRDDSQLGIRSGVISNWLPPLTTYSSSHLRLCRIFVYNNKSLFNTIQRVCFIKCTRVYWETPAIFMVGNMLQVASYIDTTEYYTKLYYNIAVGNKSTNMIKEMLIISLPFVLYMFRSCAY